MPAVIESIEIAPATLRMLPGESKQLIATARDAKRRPLAGLNVIWSSTDSTKAKVSPSGVVLALAPGSVGIAASSQEKRGIAHATIGPAPRRRYVAVAAGDAHTCALTAEGVAYCWGADGAGQLGTGSLPNSPRGTSGPAASRLRSTPVVGGLAFASLTASLASTCGITIGGDAYCWGSDLFGQLGARDSAAPEERGRVRRPRPLEGPPSFVQIESGQWHACGLEASGRAYCWGGADTIPVPVVIGRSDRRNSPTPLPVQTTVRFRSLTAGPFHTCGVTARGEAFCWGDADNIGAGRSEFRGPRAVLPVRVARGVTWRVLEAGLVHTCGLTAEGRAYCWGGNDNGQLGNGTRADSSRPVPIAGDLTFALIDADWTYTCGLTTAGIAYCWGANDFGQLGDGTTTASSLPVRVAGNLRFKDMAIGQAHACAIAVEGGAYCWGWNGLGQLGRDAAMDEDGPRPAQAGRVPPQVEPVPVRVADPE